jgi:hypothetical protein
MYASRRVGRAICLARPTQHPKKLTKAPPSCSISLGCMRKAQALLHACMHPTDRKIPDLPLEPLCLCMHAQDMVREAW